MIPSSVHFGDTKRAYSSKYNNILLCSIKLSIETPIETRKIITKYLLELTLNDLKPNWNEIILRFSSPKFV